MTYNTLVSSSGFRRLSVSPDATMLNNVCHNSEETILTSADSRNILETNRPDIKSESVSFCRGTEKKQVCLKTVTNSSPNGQTCHRILQHSLFNNSECVNCGLIQQHGTSPKDDRRLYRTASLDNVTDKPEHSNNQFQHVSCCHVNHEYKICDRRVERRLEFSQGLGNFSWTTGKLLLVLLLSVDLSSALRDKELSVTDINSTRQSPCLLHFPTTTLVYARHPYNCSIFYLCYAFKQWEMICKQENTVFSLKHRVCVWKNSNLDDCQDNSTENEVDNFSDQTFPNNVDNTNNKPFQLSNNKRIDTKLDSQYAILTRQPLKMRNSEIRRKETLKDNVADFYEELKKDTADMLQKPTLQGIKQEFFNSQLQIKHKPESWYTFMVSSPQTLDTSVHNLSVEASTADFIKEAQTLVSFDKTNETTPFNFEERLSVADSNMSVADSNMSVADSNMSVADSNLFVGDGNSVNDGEEVILVDGNSTLEGTRLVSMSGEKIYIRPDEMKYVLSRETEDYLSAEMADVLPGETRVASPEGIDNELPDEVNQELPVDRIDYTSDKTDLSFLDEAEYEHKYSSEVRIEGTTEDTITPENRTKDNVNSSGDFATNITHFGFTYPDIVSSIENIDKSVGSIEVGEAMKLNDDVIYPTTNDRNEAHIKSTVTVSKIRMNTIPQFELPVGEFLEAVDLDLSPDMQYIDTEALPRLDPPLVNGIELALPVDKEYNSLNDSAKMRSVDERESKASSWLGSYGPELSWLNLPEAHHVDLNHAEVTENELEGNNYSRNKQQRDFVYQNVKYKNVLFQDIKIPVTSQVFQNTIISDWNKLENPKLDIHLSNYQKDHKAWKQQTTLTKKQHFGEEFLRNEYQHWNNSTIVEKYGEPRYHQLETASISPESTLVIRPWQGLSSKLSIPPPKYKLFNSLYVKGIDQRKYISNPLRSNVFSPRQLVNTHTKTTKLGESGFTVKKQIKSISDKVHKSADKISHIFWLNSKSATPTLKNQTFVKMVNQTKMSPKQTRGKLHFHKSPMWYLKSRYINMPLARPTYKFERPRKNKDRLGYALIKPRQHNNKSRRMRIISKKNDNTKIAKRLKIKKTKKQNKNFQHKENRNHRSKNNKRFIPGVQFIQGRYDKDRRYVRFIADTNNKDSKESKLISSKNNFKDTRDVKFIPGRDTNIKRENVNYYHGKHFGSIGDKVFNPDHSQDRIMPKYYRRYLQQKIHHLLHLQHPSLNVRKKDNNHNSGPVHETKQSRLSNHGPLKETKQTQPSKQTTLKISGSEKLQPKSSLKLDQWENPQYTVSKMQLPQLGIQSDQNTNLGHVYSETDVDSQHINEKRISDLRTLNQIHTSDEENAKKYHSSKQESITQKTTVDKNAIDDLYLGNIIDGSATNTDNSKYGRHTLRKTRNKPDLKLEDLKIESLPKLFLEARPNIPDWEKSRGFSYKILARPKMSLHGHTTTTTMSVYPPSTNQPSPSPSTAATTTTASTTTTTASTTVSSTTLPDMATLNTTTTSTPSAHRPPTQNSDLEEIPDYRKELKDRCGIMATPLIIGGRKSRAGQWPWQVSLQIVSSTTPWHRCGGVLVHARWVLTAAHCVEGPFYGDTVNWRVVMADYDLDSVSGNEIYRSIRRVISHPEYVRSSNFPNDVALLELDSPVDLTSGDVQTACLPDTDFPLTPGTKCWISGWGETRGSGGKENVMNEVPVDVMAHDQCKPMWGKVDIDVLDSQVCLGYGDTGACYGDSGGPLMCESEGRFYVAGVMSWLINNCSATNFPNVFTRLPNYMDWLYKELDYFEWFRHL